MKKKIIKISVAVLSIAVIVFAVVNIVNPKDNAADTDVNFTELAEWSSEKTDNKCRLNLIVYDNGKVSVDVEFDQFGTNGFYEADELYNCEYDSDIIFWDFNYGDKYDSYAGIVPEDCVGAQIDGVMYESKSGELEIDNETKKFRYIITDVSHLQEHKIALIDEKGNSHTQKTTGNPND